MTPGIRLGRVTLSAYEQTMAREIAVARSLGAKGLGYQDSHGLGKTQMGDPENVFGILGEIATAKLQGVPLPPKTHWRTTEERDEISHHGDLWGHEIRTVLKRGRRMIIRPGDADRPTILVWPGEAEAEMELVGWGWAGKLKRAEFLWDPGGRPPAYFVGVEHLCRSQPSELLVRVWWDLYLTHHGHPRGPPRFPLGNPYEGFIRP